MGNLQRPSKGDHVLCKKHPKHKQSPGVCSLCLNEKLSQVSKTRFHGRSTDSSSSSSSYSSSSSSSTSSYLSPMHHHYRFSTREGNNKSSPSFPESRSMASFVPTRDGGDDGYSDYYYKKKTRRGWFWSKWSHPRMKTIVNGLLHSSSVTERTLVIA